MKNKQKLVLTVPDMMCVHCEGTIQRALAAIGAKAKANHLAKEVVVTYDAAQLTPDGIRQAIVEAGYTVQ